MSFYILSQTYKISDDPEVKTKDIATPLWTMLKQSLEGRFPTILRDKSALDYMVDRVANYTYSRLLIRGMLLLKQGNLIDDPPEDVGRFSDVVAEILDLPENQRYEIALRLEKLCKGISKERSGLSANQKRAIVNFANTNGHRCYICGVGLSYSSNVEHGKGSKNNFQIEHIVPGKRGGSRSKSNLAASCAWCNNIKNDLLTFVDFPVENYFTTSTDENRVKETFLGKPLFALLWSQGGKCTLCGFQFWEKDSDCLYLYRREETDGYHFFNLFVACGNCAAVTGNRGIKLR